MRKQDRIRLLDDCAKIAMSFILEANIQNQFGYSTKNIADLSYKTALEMILKRREIIKLLGKLKEWENE